MSRAGPNMCSMFVVFSRIQRTTVSLVCCIPSGMSVRGLYRRMWATPFHMECSLRGNLFDLPYSCTTPIQNMLHTHQMFPNLPFWA